MVKDEYLIREIFDLFRLPMVFCSQDELYAHLPEEKGMCPLAQDEKMRGKICTFSEKMDKPYMYLENTYIYYGVIPLVENDLCIIGPISRMEPTREVLENYRHIHGTEKKFEIGKCGFGTASKLLVLGQYLLTGEKTDISEVSFNVADTMTDTFNPDSDMEHYQLEQSEEDRTHDSIDYENQVMNMVKNGDVDGMKAIMNIDMIDTDDIGKVADSSLKQTEYLIVSFIALITRAAIEGGLLPEYSYQMGDIYLRELEKCKTAMDMSLVGAKAQIAFTEAVRDAKLERSRLSYIEECKDYIAKHLRQPFKVGDIAPAINVNRTYLAKKFTEIEGITIQQYIMKERCKHAANLLKYSDYPISIISEYFSFASQSHFGVQFRKYYGVTPNEYRNNNKYIGSYDSSQNRK